MCKNCKFDEAWIGKCKKDTIKGEEYCEEHLGKKCSICGKQATHNCAETMQLVCGTLLCDSLECKLQHFYQIHGYAFSEIAFLEKELNKKHFKLIVSKINFGVSEFSKYLNEAYKDKLEVLLATYNDKNEVKFYNAHYFYHANKKDEIKDLFKSTFYKEEIEKAGVYFYDGEINVEKVYTDDITLEKII